MMAFPVAMSICWLTALSIVETGGGAALSVKPRGLHSSRILRFDMTH